MRICQNLVGVFNGEGWAGPPVHHHRNAWGGFTFRAYKLDPTDAGSSLIGVVIDHQEPLPVKLLRLGSLGFTVWVVKVHDPGGAPSGDHIERLA